MNFNVAKSIPTSSTRISVQHLLSSEELFGHFVIMMLWWSAQCLVSLCGYEHEHQPDDESEDLPRSLGEAPACVIFFDFFLG